MDGPTPGSVESVILTVGNGSLNISNLSGATISSGALNSNTLTLSGTLAQLNAALDTLTYNRNGFVGNTSLTIVANDGQYNSASQSINLTVYSEPPILTADTGLAIELGGITNSSLGSPIGSPAIGKVLDNDTDLNAGGTLSVLAVALGSTPGTVGTGLRGAYGTLSLKADGSYIYVVDDINPTVQALNIGQSLSETFTYTAQYSLSLLTASTTLTITILGTDDTPTIATNTLAVVKGASVVLSNLNLNAIDPDNTPGQLTYTVTALSGGQFQLVNVPGVAITKFTQAQVNSGAVRFIDTSGSTLPTYSLSVSDSNISSSVSSTTVTRYTPPIARADSGTALEAGGTNNDITGSDATGNVITNDTNPNTAGSLFVIAVALGSTAGTVGTGLTGKYGTLTLNANGSYTYVVDNTNPRVQALKVGKSLTETFIYTLFDSLSGLTASSTLAVKIQGSDDAPTISTNTLAIAQGSSVVLRKRNIAATDPDNTAAQLTYTASEVVAGQFELVSTPGIAITSFTQAQINAGAIRFVSTGSTPSTYNLTVSDGLLSSPVNNGSITFYTPPIANADTGAAREVGGINNAISGSNATGNVLTNDSNLNAGGTPSVSAVAFGTTAGKIGAGLAGAYGTLTLRSDGTYTYVVNNANPMMQALNVGDSLTETFTYTNRYSRQFHDPCQYLH